MKRKLDRTDKRNLTAADVAIFMKSYGRQRQKRREPNDRQYDREQELTLKRMPPEALDALLRDDEEG